MIVLVLRKEETPLRLLCLESYCKKGVLLFNIRYAFIRQTDRQNDREKEDRRQDKARQDKNEEKRDCLPFSNIIYSTFKE